MAMANEVMNLAEKDDTNFFIRFIKYFIPWKGDSKNEVIRKIIFDFSVALFVFSIMQLSDFLHEGDETKSYVQEIVSYEPDFEVDKNKTTTTTDMDIASPDSVEKDREVQDWSKNLLNRNSDVVGWIKIPGFKNSDGDEYINFPVLQGRDNEEYLTLNLDKQYYESGSIFADAWATINKDGQSDNITIYGHHMRYLGTSFTHLAEYKKGVDFLKKYPIIEFNTIYESNCQYIIIGAFVASTKESQDNGNIFRYNTYRYFDDADYKFEDWIANVKKYSWYSSDAECTADDKYITLSTCTNEVADMRWVIIAKKITADDNVDKIIESYKEKNDKDIYFPKCWRDIYGNEKQYFGWDY